MCIVHKILYNLHVFEIGVQHDNQHVTLLEIMSSTTSHYAIDMQLTVVYNYLCHVSNYKFDII